MKESALLQPRTESHITTIKKERYQSITDFIMFSIVEMRPDITFITSVVPWFAKNLGYQYTKAVKTILQYLQGLKEQKITFGSQEKLFLER